MQTLFQRLILIRKPLKQRHCFLALAQCSFFGTALVVPNLLQLLGFLLGELFKLIVFKVLDDLFRHRLLITVFLRSVVFNLNLKIVFQLGHVLVGRHVLSPSLGECHAGLPLHLRRYRR